MKSKYPLRSLGAGQENILLSEEQREHMHIIGTTGEGKSYLLLHLMMGDIKRGNGLCFLDPSDGGDTMYKLLRYCAKIKHKKVLLIDPLHRYTYNTVCPINPFSKYKEASVSNVRDTLQVVFRNKDQSETPIIQRYLTAILSVLHQAGMTLHESIYFTEPLYKIQREKVLNRVDELDRHRLMLENVFHNKALYMEFQSTIRRLEPLFHPIIDLMFGSRDGVKFTDLIADGWVVLVNLYSETGFEPIHSRLLGTTIINEIITAIDRLRRKGWEGRYYLYIDEAGRYANRNLADLLAHKRKTGLRVTLSHQYLKQFEDLHVLEAIKNLCKIKIAFNIPNPEDRMQIVKAMYGGDLADRDVSYALSNLRKQNAVVKLPKKEAHIIRINDIKIPEVNLDEYIKEIYKNPVYQTPNEIIHDQTQRLYEDRPSANYPTTLGKSTNVKRGSDRSIDFQTTLAPSIFDAAREAERIQRNKQTARKDDGQGANQANGA